MINNMTERQEMKLRGLIHSKFKNINAFMDKAGITRTFFYYWLDGGKISEDHIKKISNALGLKEDKIKKLF